MDELIKSGVAANMDECEDECLRCSAKSNVAIYYGISKRCDCYAQSTTLFSIELSWSNEIGSTLRAYCFHLNELCGEWSL
uniref:Apple domain-containing protein n=1 Tax=Mesocestoides corti TaxID=53468 RepID=A0A5K3FVY5_MESCO